VKPGLSFAFFGSSLVSAYWNGAATYYRGIIRALAARGHRMTFYEPDAYERQQHRDIDDPPWCKVVVYGNDERAMRNAVRSARGHDVVVKASGVGVFDAELEASVLGLQCPATRIVFWDVDAPATLERLNRDERDPLRALVPRFDRILTYGGGDPVVRGYAALGARACTPVYNALDPETHFPAPPEARFSADLAFLGNRLPDREARVDEFFFGAAAALPSHTFLLGGAGWEERGMPPNVRYVGHVSTRDHNAFNCTALVTLNVARDSMAKVGFSPATRVFEAAGAGACILTDAWKGIERFLEPDREVLVAASGAEVAAILRDLSPDRARAIGAAARRRVLGEHTYAHRAREVESLLYHETRPAPAAELS
jgi:spore maturation protein CgeB